MSAALVIFGDPYLLWHLGALHPVERALVLVLAFGPFLALGIVVLLRRREGRRSGHRDR